MRFSSFLDFSPRTILTVEYHLGIQDRLVLDLNAEPEETSELNPLYFEFGSFLAFVVIVERQLNNPGSHYYDNQFLEPRRKGNQQLGFPESDYLRLISIGIFPHETGVQRTQQNHD